MKLKEEREERMFEREAQREALEQRMHDQMQLLINNSNREFC